MTSPWIPAAPLGDEDFARLRRRAIFDCCKWDPQVGDACSIARYPLVVSRAAWKEVVELAEALARETMAAEEELVHRHDLHRQLALPRAIRAALKRAGSVGPPCGAARLIRFDFHCTAEGWRISEANCDVAGGLNEASGFPLLMLPHFGWASPVGDPVAAYVAALSQRAGGSGTVALVHATAYSDDQQMMLFVARRLEQAGLSVHLASPSHLSWRGATASREAEWWAGPLDLVMRFFPAEWLGGLPRSTEWSRLFAGTGTPLSNPATAILPQSKRFPLIWSDLRTPLPTWRALLPDTRDPRQAPWRTSDEWVLKPAFGRVGEGIGLSGLTEPRELRRIARAARLWPSRGDADRHRPDRGLHEEGVLKAAACRASSARRGHSAFVSPTQWAADFGGKNTKGRA